MPIDFSGNRIKSKKYSFIYASSECAVGHRLKLSYSSSTCKTDNSISWIIITSTEYLLYIYCDVLIYLCIIYNYSASHPIKQFPWGRLHYNCIIYTNICTHLDQYNTNQNSCSVASLLLTIQNSLVILYKIINPTVQLHQYSQD